MFSNGRPRSITIDSLMPSIPESPQEEATKPRSNSFNNLLSPSMTPTLEFAGRYKIVVIGDTNCGKTSLLNAFSKRHYEVDTALTYDEGVLTVRYGSKHVEFVMWDLSGCSEYVGLRIQLYQDTDLFLICFDIGNEESLENAVEEWIPEVLVEEPKTPFILVGCKYDVREEQTYELVRNKSIVRKMKAEQVARDWGAKDYIECSAKTGHNIAEVFKSGTQVLISPLDEKNNLYGLKGLSRFRRRKTPENSEIFYFAYNSESLLTDNMYPSYTRNYLRLNSVGST